MAFTEQQKALLKAKMPELSHHFFTTIYENDCAALRMFSFIKDIKEAPEKNDPMLQDYAMKIFTQIYDLAAVAGKTRKKLDTKKLGFVTLKKGVKEDDHLQVVKEALLSAVEKVMGKNKGMREAWSVAYDYLAAAIKVEMNQEAAGPSQRV